MLNVAVIPDAIQQRARWQQDLDSKVINRKNGEIIEMLACDSYAELFTN